MKLVTGLKRMRQLLTPEKNWTRGELRNGKGAYCLLGAAIEVGCMEKFVEFGDCVIQHDVNQSCGRIVEFNDSPSTKHKHILAFLDKLIKMKERKK
jgi:hypothetical protein